MIRVVEDIDSDRNTFLHSQEWARNLAVVAESVNGPAGSDIKRNGRNAQSEVGFGLETLVPFSKHAARSQAHYSDSRIFQKIPAFHVFFPDLSTNRF